MKTVLLTSEHRDSVRGLFYIKKHMGIDIEKFNSDDFSFVLYDTFCDTFLSDLRNYKAFGTIGDNGDVLSYVSFYESIDNPEWYLTQIRSIDHKTIPYSLDKSIEYNESCGKYQFYSTFNLESGDGFRRLIYSDRTRSRYDYVDEFIVPAKTKCIYSMPWQILFNRMLLPMDTVVRRTYLKPEFRVSTPIGGKL